jgi:hypothetical protein
LTTNRQQTWSVGILHSLWRTIESSTYRRIDLISRYKMSGLDLNENMLYGVLVSAKGNTLKVLQ